MYCNLDIDRKSAHGVDSHYSVLMTQSTRLTIIDLFRYAISIN